MFHRLARIGVLTALLVGAAMPAQAAPQAASDTRAASVSALRIPSLLDPIDSAMCRAGRVNHEIIRYTAEKQYGLSFYGRVSLTCGYEMAGYKHIKIEHASDWLRMLTKYGGHGSWDNFMSFATAQALAAPSLVRNVGNGKYCYTTPIQIYQGGKLVKTFYPKVIVSTTTRRVITSYPHSTGC